MATDFADRTALVTGAGRGIGRAVALGLGAAGARVILLARTPAQLEQTHAQLRQHGVPADRVSILPADLADEGAAAAPWRRRSPRAASTSWSTTRPR